MYLKVDGEFADGDYNHLSKYLSLLNQEFIPVMSTITISKDPESLGLFDYGEYIVGSAYTAIQRYFCSTFPQCNLSKKIAFSIGPEVTSGLTFANAINAGANYWKHLEEWGGANIVYRDIDGLKGNAKETIEMIEKATPWSDYTCTNLLAVILKAQEFEFTRLLPYIQDWRFAVDSHSTIQFS